MIDPWTTCADENRKYILSETKKGDISQVYVHRYCRGRARTTGDT